MKRIGWTFLVFFLAVIASAQSQTEDPSGEQREKLEIILRIQDLRTIHDGTLISLLGDNDPVVRERAVRAYGSIQDTTVLNLHVSHLEDSDPRVQYAATFAIGQTATMLSKSGRQTLQHDLIWARLDRMSATAIDRLTSETPQGKLVEEIGKFGTEEALSDLLTRFGNSSAGLHPSLIMSIARFAIRGITSTQAIEYVLQYVKPADSAPWQAVYALQRIGDRKELRHEILDLIPLSKHRDPLVRMHLATLLGKLKDKQSSLEPLMKLSEFDSDWRVRVNALKALSNLDLHNEDEAVAVVRRAFFNENTYIALIALSSFGNSGLTSQDSSRAVLESISALEQISENQNNGYLWQLQGEAAMALAKVKGKDALPFIHTGSGTQRHLDERLLSAIGTTGSPDAARTLLSYADGDDKLLARAALEGLQTLSGKNPNNSEIVEETYSRCLAALESGDMALVTTGASILGDSLFLRLASVDPLLETLTRLHIPDDVEALQEVVATLGKLKDRRAIEALTRQMHQPDRSVALASSSALKSITGQDYSSELPKMFEPLLTDFDFKYLRALPETVRVKLETIRGDAVIELYKNFAPFTVMSTLKLASQRGFYRGLTFHRVEPNFVVQGGDPRGDGWGGPGYSIRSEFSPLTFDTGMLGIASAGKDTEGSQFFITQSPQPHLDGRYTIFGKVVSGMDVVNRILVDDHIFDLKILD